MHGGVGGVFCLVVAGGAVESRGGPEQGPQKSPVRLRAGARGRAGTSEDRRNPPPEDPGASEGGEGGEGDSKKGTPAERAVKLMEAARAKVTKSRPDAEGRRERTLKHIDKAISETRAHPAGKE